jgi:uncharacterized membrane protein
MVMAPRYSQLTIWPFCTSCHSSAVTGAARMRAPVGFDYDTYTAAQASARAAAATVHSDTMPPHGQPIPTDDQKNSFYAWALCGTPP